MGLTINTHFHPFRMRLRKRDPVELGVEVINRDNTEKMLTLQVATARQVAFDKGGLNHSALERIESLAPGKSANFYFKVFPKHMTHTGEVPVQVKVLEHHNDYNHVLREHTKNLELTVVEE